MAAAGTIPKPQLRRLLEARIKKALVGAVISTALAGITWKYTVCEPRKKQYADFYKTYNLDEKYKIMCDAGLLQAVPKK